jgi:hypothetical protein
MFLVLLLQQQPIVVELAKQPEPTRDISIEVILSMFAVAGIFLLVAAVGSAIVAGATIVYKRWRDGSAPPSDTTHSHIRLKI